MPWYDLPIDELRLHRTSSIEPPDLDCFWQAAIREADEAAEEPILTPYRSETYGAIKAYDVTFTGAEGHPIRAWYLRPAGVSRELPCLVQFIGYGGGRGLPVDHALYPACGYATFVMDSRAQGGSWTPGHTGDPGAGISGAEAPGVMTRGILSPRTYYFRRLYVDAVRAIDTVRALPGVDRDRVGVTGFSQGGALALVAASLRPDEIRLCQAEMPFLCDIERAMTLAPEAPYTELAAFLRIHPDHEEAVRATLRHVDCALLASRVRARTTVSAGLMDPICPPSTVFAAYNAITAPKEIRVFSFNEHDQPPVYAEERLETFVREMA